MKHFFFSWSINECILEHFSLYIFLPHYTTEIKNTECELNGNKLYKNFNKITNLGFFSSFFFW